MTNINTSGNFPQSSYNLPPGTSETTNSHKPKGFGSTGSTSGANQNSPTDQINTPSPELQDLINTLSQNRGVLLPGDPNLPPGASQWATTLSEWLQPGIAGKLALIMSDIAKLNIDQNPMMTQFTVRLMEATKQLAIAMKDLQLQSTQAQAESIKADAEKARIAGGIALASAVIGLTTTLASSYFSLKEGAKAHADAKQKGITDPNELSRLQGQAVDRHSKLIEGLGSTAEKVLGGARDIATSYKDDTKAKQTGIQGNAAAIKELAEKALQAMQKTLQDLTEALKSDQDKLKEILGLLKEVQQLETQITRQA